MVRGCFRSRGRHCVFARGGQHQSFAQQIPDLVEGRALPRRFQHGVARFIAKWLTGFIFQGKQVFQHHGGGASD